jgi:aryl-alcohol dehydrogenase-like predicted oxidoreductase
MGDFLHSRLGSGGPEVFRLGLSASYGLDEGGIRTAIDGGVNYLFWYYWTGSMVRVLRGLPPSQRERLVVATGGANVGPWMVKRAIDSCRKRIRSDYIDVFQIFWVGAGKLSARTLDVLQRAKEQGKIRHIAISTHARPYAAELIRDHKLDVIMMRYNAAHRGAEQEIFPHVEASQPGVVAYTATRWGKLLVRPKTWPASEPVPTAGDCYRFVLSSPNVNVCLSAPRNLREMEENFGALRRGPLSPEEMTAMRRFGDAVHAEAKRFW